MNFFSKIAKISIPILLGVGICWYAFSKFTPEQIAQIKENIQKADYTFLTISIFLGILSNISRGLRWRYALAPMGFSPKKRNAILSIFVSYLLNLTIPRSGEISRALILTRYDNVPFDKSFGTIISERIIDLIILFSFVFLAFVLQFDLLFQFISEKIPFQKLIFLMFFGGITFLSFIIFLWKSESYISKKIKHLLSGLKEGVFSIFKLEKKWTFIAHTIFIWAMYFLMFYISFFSLEATQNIPLPNIVTAFVIGSLAIGFTNGGFGAYPVSIAEVLALFGVALTTGTTLGWVMWLAQTLMIVIFGGFSFLLLPFINKKK